MADVIDRAIRLYEDGQLTKAASLLRREIEDAKGRGDSTRVAEIDKVLSQMRSQLEGDELARFDDAFLGAAEPDSEWRYVLLAVGLVAVWVVLFVTVSSPLRWILGVTAVLVGVLVAELWRPKSAGGESRPTPATPLWQPAGQPWWFWWMGASAVLVCIGSVGPWASVLIVTVNGLSGDGQLSLGAGILALIFIVAYTRYTPPRPAWPSVLILLAGLFAGVGGAADWVDLQRTFDAGSNNVFTASASVGWGLVLVTVAGFSLALAAFTSLVNRASEEPSVSAASEAPPHLAQADGRPQETDPAEQLRKLAELRDAGIVSDDEFAAKKAELLGRM